MAGSWHKDEVPIFVLNTDDAPDRLVAVWADAERLGLRIERVGYVSTDDGQRDRLDAHASAWARIADGASRFAIVAEDDVGLDARLLPLLDVPRLARDLAGGAVVCLNGGPVDHDEVTRILPASRFPRDCNAYLLDRDTALSLRDMATDCASLPALFTGLSAGGLATMVATPAPIPGVVHDENVVEANGLLARLWRRYRSKRKASDRSNDGNVPSARMTIAARRG